MAKTNLYDMTGKVIGEIELNDTVFGIEPNTAVMHEVVKNHLANMRQGTQSTLTRAEVRGGGRKPWRQKGTGRARQGSTRATQWRHGAIAFGPHPRKYGFKLNRKVRQLALRSALSEKAQADDLVVVENVSFDEMKTKKAVAMMKAFNFDRKTLIVADASEDFANAFVSFRNIPNAGFTTVSNLNVYDIVNADKIVFTEAAAATAGEVFAA